MHTNLMTVTSKQTEDEVVERVMDNRFNFHEFEPPYVCKKDHSYAVRKMDDGSLQIWEVNGIVTLESGKQDYRWVREADKKLHS